jgi:hypothetical protein
VSRFVLLLVPIALAATATYAMAQPVPAKPNTGGIAVKSVKTLRQSGAGPKVIGGIPAKSSDWPASFFSTTPSARCTATLVGPAVLLLAAHCVGNGMTATIDLAGKSYKGKCTHADEYKQGSGDPSADYALCKFADPIPGGLPENISLNPVLIWRDELLTLTGYGCTEPNNKVDGVFRLANANVALLPGQFEPNTIVIQDKADLDTRGICPGDSGGGDYIIFSTARRLLVSINSRVSADWTQSYLSSLSATGGINFVKKWAEANGNILICGYNLKDKPCRGL